MVVWLLRRSEHEYVALYAVGLVVAPVVKFYGKELVIATLQLQQARAGKLKVSSEVGHGEVEEVQGLRSSGLQNYNTPVSYPPKLP